MHHASAFFLVECIHSSPCFTRAHIPIALYSEILSFHRAHVNFCQLLGSVCEPSWSLWSLNHISHFLLFSCQVMSHSLQFHGLQHARPPCPSSCPRVCPSSCPLSWWCHSTISSSVTPFSSCPQSFPASGSFPTSRLFESGGQSIELQHQSFQYNIQCWFPLGLTGWISLQSKGFSRIFSNTTVQKHQFFSTLPSLWPSSHICTWLLEKP